MLRAYFRYSDCAWAVGVWGPRVAEIESGQITDRTSALLAVVSLPALGNP